LWDSLFAARAKRRRNAAAVDRVMALMLERYGSALLAGDTAWLEKFRWFSDACDRVQVGQAAVRLDG